ncbi:MAG: glycogen/starch/alpha-glucan family phosphorylase [Clostridia bacterium]|nr:glycogen/starch/alpha-glucan family phosphorylase [Clostridia bacterium]
MSSLSRDLALFARTAYQRTPQQLTPHQLHHVLAQAVLLHIAPAWERSRHRHATRRRAYYLSAEFLVGRAIGNNLLCTGLWDDAMQALTEMGIDSGVLEEMEDAALGNGGLGRLAACFLDSAATLGLPLDGYGIRYRYGLFRQAFRDGFQQEEADDWTRHGDPWSVRREEEAVTVTFGDGPVRAVPYDMPIIGYGGRHISTLRLWQCEPVTPFDFRQFNDQQYDKATRLKNRAEDISRVLYPNDSTPAGRLLRLKQQYFFCSASMQDMLRSFEVTHGDGWEQLPKFVTVQLNDTHPVIAVPELVRLLTGRGVAFEEAAHIAEQVFNYTNHTIMQEALEKWDMATVRKVSPAIARLITRLSRLFDKELDAAGVAAEARPQLQILQGDTVHMAHLACRYSTHINGVAQIHTDILRERVLNRWHRLYPGKILNMTNGITQRRWLALCNRPLATLLTDLLGEESWATDLGRLRELERYAADREVLQRFIAVKKLGKERLAVTLRNKEGVQVNTEALFDVQIKRLHEYKRQLLNILCILELYFEIKEGSLKEFAPTLFLFGAKAAPGYARAKGIIKLIHEVAALIRQDEAVNRLMQVVFVTDYNVSYAEQIVAAADVSEQISTAGTEASGTGNMKLMLNGAVTLGTYDGANIEIVGEAGEENNYIFGARVEEIEAAREDYDPKALYQKDSRIRRCLDALVDGTLSDGGTGMFRELYTSLLEGASWHAPDHYFLLLDFDACLQAKKQVNTDYRTDRLAFAAKQWHNICAAGKFSSDRTIAEYAKAIWKIK